MILAHDQYEKPGQKVGLSAFVVHGVLGSKRNWGSFCRRAVAQMGDLRAVAVDLRGHGESASGDHPHTLAACADDLIALAQALDIHPGEIWGHSLGGKVVLEYAKRATRPPQRVWVLDSALGKLDGGDALGVKRVFEVLRSMQPPFESRRQVQEKLKEAGLPEAIGAWMTTNLKPAEGGHGFVFRFDLEVCAALLEDYGRWDFWPMLDAPPPSTEIHVVRAAKSARWTEGERARLNAAARHPRVFAHTLAHAGHWLHVDNPKGLLDLLLGQGA
jgi:pimeloyl-ACP methyl ester carboxylesterase